VFFHETKTFLYKQEFGRYLKIEGVQDAGRTERFEILIKNPFYSGDGETNILVHSKSRRHRRGDWLLRTDEEKERLIQSIDAVLLAS